MKNVVFIGIIFVYLSVSTLVFLSSVSKHRTHPQLFYQDYSIPDKMRDALAADSDTRQFSILLTRVFYNKPFFAADTFIIHLYQALDPTVLFSLSSVSLYGEPIQVPFLYSWELPFFLLAVVICIRNWNRFKKYHLTIYGMVAVSLLSAGLISPSYYPLKFLPLIITIRVITVLGILEFLKTQKWSKKYFS